MNFAALIPAYNPTTDMVNAVQELVSSECVAIIVINDGSASSFEKLFEQISKIEKVVVLKHAINLGKGAALKTGMNYAYCNLDNLYGVIVLDADGQHLVSDALNVASLLKKHLDSLIMGVRAFDKNVPLRSKIGNTITRSLFRVITGSSLSDTQSGLRGIPRDFIPALLRINSNRYEFELDMLLACKYTGRTILEQPIQTVYIEGNKSSHFNPILDSMKIYFVLFRFSIAALFSALIDYSVFFLIYYASHSIFVSQACARFISMGFNYAAVKRAVFYSKQKSYKTFPKYLALVMVSGLISYLLIQGLVIYAEFSILASKLSAELIVFLANFAIQRDFIFVANTKKKSEIDGLQIV